MKKYLFILTIMFCFNTANSQVLYAENFDNFNWGYLGTDPTGKIPGQGGWVTISKNTQSNSFFTIVNEPNRGKVLDITAMVPQTEQLYVYKTGVDKLIDNRAPGNDVIKFEIDYFTGPKTAGNSDITILYLLGIGEQVGGIQQPDYLFRFSFEKNIGDFGLRADPVIGGGSSPSEYDLFLSNNQNTLYLPFNTWIKIIVYLDYPNKKAYAELPYFNKAFVGAFLKNNPSTNIVQDYKLATVSLETSVLVTSQSQSTISRNKYDNIQITALKEVPPNVIALSVNEQLATKFNLYPNPATNVVNITNAENMQVNQITVYNVTSKQVSTQDYNNQAEIHLNVEHLASGTYLLYLQTAQGTAVKQFIKK